MNLTTGAETRSVQLLG